MVPLTDTIAPIFATVKKVTLIFWERREKQPPKKLPRTFMASVDRVIFGFVQAEAPQASMVAKAEPQFLQVQESAK
jgi:hypothetical protein